jgi:hypothetical protein
LNHTCDAGIERVVFASPHVLAGLEARTSLTNDDGATAHDLSAEGFDSQPLCIRVPPVPGAPLTFFMCHGSLISLGVYFFDPNCRERLTMAPGPSVSLPAFFLENKDLGATTLLRDGPRNSRTIDIRTSQLDVAVTVQHEDLVELHGRAHFSVEPFNPDLFTWFDLVLLTTAFYNCVQRSPPSPTEIQQF